MPMLFKPFGSPKKEAALLAGVAEVKGVGDGPFDALLASCDMLQADIEIQVDDALLEKAKNLRAVLCRTIGVDFVDLAAATRRGVLVVNSPAYCVEAVAEYAVGLMFAAARAIPEASCAVRGENWNVRGKLHCVELRGKTLGVLGFGKIGRRVAEMARGLGMEFVAYDPYAPAAAAEQLGGRLLDLDGVMRASDFLTIHLPLTPETRGMVGVRELSLMRDGSFLINVARGGVADETAVVEALRTGKLAAAALDVMTEEPPSKEHVLFTYDKPNLILTPHVAWSSLEARVLNDEVFRAQAEAVAAGRVPEHVLNPDAVEAWLKTAR